jgi:small redox-active disulfide protein 2
MQTVQVLGPGCPECRQLKADVESAIERIGMETAVEHVTDISRIIAMDVMLTPALVINGEVCLVGPNHSIAQLEEILRSQIKDNRIAGEQVEK